MLNQSTIHGWADINPLKQNDEVDDGCDEVPIVVVDGKEIHDSNQLERLEEAGKIYYDWNSKKWYPR